MNKILSFKLLVQEIKKLKKKDKKIGYCNGNYDLLHPGHAKHFESAKKLCDVLVVSVASDAFVKKWKDKSRPVFSEKLRAYMVSQLEPVDFVTINTHHNGSGIKFFNLLKPDYYIRGPDYINSRAKQYLKEKALAIKAGCAVRYTKDLKLSAREIIKSIKENKTYRIKSI